MIKQDYLMRMILQFFEAMFKTWEKHKKDPLEAAKDIEDAIATATELDAEALLALAPDSIAQIMKVSHVDETMVPFVGHSLLLEAVYLREAGRADLADLREAQARAIAAEYGFDLPSDPSDFDALRDGIEAQFGCEVPLPDSLSEDAIDLDDFPWLKA